MCNAPIQLNGDVLAVYLSKYGGVEVLTPLKASNWTEHGDYILTVCLDREDFLAIPHIFSSANCLQGVVWAQAPTETKLV